MKPLAEHPVWVGRSGTLFVVHLPEAGPVVVAEGALAGSAPRRGEVLVFSAPESPEPFAASARPGRQALTAIAAGELDADMIVVNAADYPGWLALFLPEASAGHG